MELRGLSEGVGQEVGNDRSRVKFVRLTSGTQCFVRTTPKLIACLVIRTVRNILVSPYEILTVRCSLKQHLFIC